jgi:hypothetical protein
MECHSGQILNRELTLFIHSINLIDDDLCEQGLVSVGCMLTRFIVHHFSLLGICNTSLD